MTAELGWGQVIVVLRLFWFIECEIEGFLDGVSVGMARGCLLRLEGRARIVGSTRSCVDLPVPSIALADEAVPMEK